MMREPEIFTENVSIQENIPAYLPLRDMVVMYLVWFALAGFYQLAQQIVLSGSEFLTEGLHFLFLITLRLLFIPVVLYFVIYRGFLTPERVGLTFRQFFLMSKVGIKIGWPFIPLTLLLVHLPLANVLGSGLKPLFLATTPETIAVSLVYSFLFFFMTLIPAFSEELLFRGLTFSFIEERIGRWQALVLSSLIYGLIYIQINIYVVVLRVTLGFLTAYLFSRSKSLLPSTMVQAMLHTGICLYALGWGWW